MAGGSWGRHWPLGFVALAGFVYLRAAANEGAWPFGATPLGASDAEGIQHRIAAVLVLGLGLLEWRARARPDARGGLAYVFPSLTAAGGILLLAHSHAAFQLKSSFLVQVTLYPEVIESVSHKGPRAVIKSHHNVGGLPERMNLGLVEPLRELFKDEVRAAGEAMGLSRAVLYRQPFPGPGLAVRCLGEITAERLSILRGADAIFEHEVREAGLYERLWQSFCVLLPVRSVGVMGDERTYHEAIALRAVESTDGMTADWARLPYDLVARVSSRIINEVRGVNRVVLDVSSKPPATIEWE